MKTAQQKKVEITFECINCRLVVTEKLEPIFAQMIKAQGGCCEGCCNHAERYYESQDYQAFEEAEENFHY